MDRIAPVATATEVWPGDSTFDRTHRCRPEDIVVVIRPMLEAPAGANVDRLVVTPTVGAF